MALSAGDLDASMFAPCDFQLTVAPEPAESQALEQLFNHEEMCELLEMSSSEGASDAQSESGFSVTASLTSDAGSPAPPMCCFCQPPPDNIKAWLTVVDGRFLCSKCSAYVVRVNELPAAAGVAPGRRVGCLELYQQRNCVSDRIPYC